MEDKRNPEDKGIEGEEERDWFASSLYQVRFQLPESPDPPCPPSYLFLHLDETEDPHQYSIARKALQIREYVDK